MGLSLWWNYINSGNCDRWLTQFMGLHIWCCFVVSYCLFVDRIYLPLPSYSNTQLSGPYCAGVLAIASMDSLLFGFNLMGISQPRCSTISTLFRHWFIEGKTHFGGEHFFIKTLKNTWVKKKLHFFTQFRENTFWSQGTFYKTKSTSKMGISFYTPVSEQSTYCTTSRLRDSH